MYVEAEDWRPPTLLKRSRLSPGAAMFGAITAAAAHVGVPIAFAMMTAFLTAIGILKDALPDEPPVERQIIEARFVKLGKILDPKKLPNRRVPLLQTAPNEQVAVSQNPSDYERPDAGQRPPTPTEDLLTRLGDRAQVFAEIAEQRDQEGRPDGIEEGTETEARTGDLYAGRLYAFFRSGWSVPTVVADDEQRRLVTDVDVSIGEDLRIASYRVRRPSGNPLFDQSVLDRLQQLKDADTPIPPPPEEVASDYIGQTVGLRFHGRDAE